MSRDSEKSGGLRIKQASLIEKSILPFLYLYFVNNSDAAFRMSLLFTLIISIDADGSIEKLRPLLRSTSYQNYWFNETSDMNRQ